MWRIIFITLLGGTALAQSATSYTEMPKPADSFVDSIGVNVHMTYGDTAYGNGSAVQKALASLGVRHVRDGAKYYSPDTAYNEYEYSAYGKLSAMGIGFDLILDPKTTPAPMTLAVMALVQDVATRHAVTVDSYEGPNEIDISGDVDWVAHTRSFMQAVRTAIKASPATASIPLLGNTLAGGPQNWTSLGDMTRYEDYGNIHPYANTQQPSYNFTADLANQNIVSGSQPIYVTEAGWSNAMKATDNSPNVTEDVAGKYVQRLFFEGLLRGFPRTYVYELLDEKPDPGLTDFQQHFGLFRNDYSAKPAATALANLISLMSDKNNAVVPASLTYSLATTSPNVHHLLFQKHDGTYWLALWQEVSNWKGWNALGTALNNPDVPVVLSLQTASPLIRLYNPHDSTAPVQSFSNQQTITVLVPDHPILVQIASNPGINLRVVSVH